MTNRHDDGSTCMADFWEQSAKLLLARAEEDEAMIVDLWAIIPPQEPSPEFTAKFAAVMARLRTEGEK